MPLYSLACRTALDPGVRQRVAQAITDTHCRLTGAPPEFVNVVFLHGYPLRAGEQINAIGGVRQGGNRTPELIERLRLDLRDAIGMGSGLPIQAISVSLIGVPSTWVMEGGMVMPEPGAESEWLAQQAKKIR